MAPVAAVPARRREAKRKELEGKRKELEEKRKSLLAGTQGELEMTLDEEKTRRDGLEGTKELLILPLLHRVLTKSEKAFPLCLEKKRLGEQSRCTGFEAKRKDEEEQRKEEEKMRKNQSRMTKQLERMRKQEVDARNPSESLGPPPAQYAPRFAFGAHPPSAVPLTEATGVATPMAGLPGARCRSRGCAALTNSGLRSTRLPVPPMGVSLYVVAMLPAGE